MGLLSLFSRSGFDPADAVLPEQTKDWFRGRLRRDGWKLYAACLPLLEWAAHREGSPELFIGWEFADLSGLLLDTLAVTGGSDDKAVVVLTRIHPPRYLVEAAASKSILLIRYDGLPQLADRVRAMKAMLAEERRAAHEANRHVPVGFTEANIDAGA